MMAKRKIDSVIEHTTPPDGNVFFDIGFNADEAANLLVRADLMMMIEDIIQARGLRQKDAATLFCVSQPRISDLLRGKIDAFTIDSLVNMLGRAGMRVAVTVTELPAERAPQAVESAPEETAAAHA
jgi:predicted XRE-type DNA-binding protein